MLERQKKQIIERAFGSRAAVGMSHIMGHLASVRLPAFVLNPVINVYSKSFGVNTAECDVPEQGFECFNAFFGRRLHPGVRPVSEVGDAVVSPCDGRITGTGTVTREADCLFRIKGSTYTLPSLLGREAGDATFDGGEFLVIYLHPRDYHRVHVPADAGLIRTVHIPGTRYPVTSWCEDRVAGIFEKNERMVFCFELPNGQRLSLVMVAAFGVGNIDTEYNPGFGKGQNARLERRFDPPVGLTRGADLGAFLLGSTVVMVWSKGAVALDDLESGPITMGRKIGSIGTSPPSKP